MAQAPPKVLIWIGDAWVDPHEVVAIDTLFTADDPAWPNVRVILSTGHVVFGLRAAVQVARAVRHPDLEVEADETTKIYADLEAGAGVRARRRSGRPGGPRPV